MNIFHALIASHQTQRALAAQLLAAPAEGKDRHRLFLELKAELAAHETAEERCFYVPLFEHDLTVDLSRHAIAEHHEMDEMVEDLEGVDTRTPEWEANARKLCEKVEHHLGEEENKFFAQAGQVLTDEQKESLGSDYEAERASLREQQAA